MIGVEFQLLVKEETSARSFTGLLILALWVLMCFLSFGFWFFFVLVLFFQYATELEFRDCTRK